MTSYNKVNGTHVVESPAIMQTLLRQEWKFDGMTMSDWYGTYSTSLGVKLGNDLEMPGPGIWRGKALARALTAGKLNICDVEQCVRRVSMVIERLNRSSLMRPTQVLKVAQRAALSGIEVAKEEVAADTPESRAILLKAAQAAVVLLKNEQAMLPVNTTQIRRIAVIGPNARTPSISGGGSASLRAQYVVTPLVAIRNLAEQSNIEVEYCAGLQVTRYLPLLDPLIADGEVRVSYYASDPAKCDCQALHSKVLASTYAFMVCRLAQIQCVLPCKLTPIQAGQRSFRHCPATVLHAARDLHHPRSKRSMGTWPLCRVSLRLRTIYCTHASRLHRGQADLYVDDQLLISNQRNQTPGDLFFGNGTVEELGCTELQVGRRYKVRMEWSNFRKVRASGTSNLHIALHDVRHSDNLGTIQLLSQSSGVSVLVHD